MSVGAGLYMYDVVLKTSRSLSHLQMSFLYSLVKLLSNISSLRKRKSNPKLQKKRIHNLCVSEGRSVAFRLTSEVHFFVVKLWASLSSSNKGVNSLIEQCRRCEFSCHAACTPPVLGEPVISSHGQLVTP